MLPSEMFRHQDAVELGLAGVYFVYANDVYLRLLDYQAVPSSCSAPDR